MAIPKYLDEKLENIGEQLMQFMQTFTKQAGVPKDSTEALQLLLISDELARTLKSLAQTRSLICTEDFKQVLVKYAEQEKKPVELVEMDLVAGSIKSMLSHL